MKVCSGIDEIRNYIKEVNLTDIVLVPTMGALHEGHLSLVRLARSVSSNVCVSIFVNPTQFGPGEDFGAYPRTLKKDLDLLEQEGVALVFTPTPDVMYKNNQTLIQNQTLSSILCGVSRPIHFGGVLTVVAKLFNIIQPCWAVFGEKDYQQLKIIEKMVLDLNFPIKILPGPIIRETSGLAKSSRNSYLTDQQKDQASGIYKTLLLLKEEVAKGNLDQKAIESLFVDKLKKYPLLEVEYVKVLNNNLEEISTIEKGTRVFVAVRVGSTRLIDNLELL